MFEALVELIAHRAIDSLEGVGRSRAQQCRTRSSTRMGGAMTARHSAAALPRVGRAAVAVFVVALLGGLHGLPAIAQGVPVTSTPPAAGRDPFAERQRAWDASRRPALPIAGARIGTRPNIDFSPMPSCGSSCGDLSAQCFSRCPGGSALDRANPASGKREPVLQQCQEQCVVQQSACLVGCEKAKPSPLPSANIPTPTSRIPLVLPASPGPPQVQVPLERGPDKIVPTKEQGK